MDQIGACMHVVYTYLSDNSRSTVNPMSVKLCVVNHNTFLKLIYEQNW